MGKRTGKPRGRPAGVLNKRTLAAGELRDKLLAEGITPLEYMLSVMRDESNDQAVRLDAAKAAAPYVHPKLNAIEHSGPDGGALIVEVVRYAESPK